MKTHILFILMLFTTSILSAQSSDAAYQEAPQEIEATFGHFSTGQVDLEEFKEEFQEMMAYMAEQTAKK